VKPEVCVSEETIKNERKTKEIKVCVTVETKLCITLKM
jgi:hypothetical protein